MHGELQTHNYVCWVVKKKRAKLKTATPFLAKKERREKKQNGKQSVRSEGEDLETLYKPVLLVFVVAPMDRLNATLS